MMTKRKFHPSRSPLYVLNAEGHTRLPTYEYVAVQKIEGGEDTYYCYSNNYMVVKNDKGIDKVQKLHAYVPTDNVRYEPLSKRYVVDYADVLIVTVGVLQDFRRHDKPYVF